MIMTPNDTIVEESAKPTLNVDMDCVRTPEKLINFKKGNYNSFANRSKVIKQPEKN